MRISDWSSDVCSSDLLLERQPSRLPEGALVQGGQVVDRRQARSDTPFAKCICCGRCGSQIAENRVAPASGNEACRAMSDCGPGERKGAVEGKRVAVRVELGVGRDIKKKRTIKK